ncbi:hypothetical protein [Candidatus Venteria ishoeyi]|uniref:Uncharacterized protein n=1 Tax=Candidatus Venteria ishoeyi TaxID=1899563 RepID=A0A1H6F2N5_9GAMM|nr:hypothetical protein [Candidatus Venteria ishoeyi]SEH04322.1 Uncharacterised protein [Candidatus Venteria ishoeyi]
MNIDRLLRKAGYMSRADWAKAHHYNKSTVYTAIRRWIGEKRDKEDVPRGQTARILEDLQKTLGKEVTN